MQRCISMRIEQVEEEAQCGPNSTPNTHDLCSRVAFIAGPMQINQSLSPYIMCSSLNWKWWQSYHVPLYWWPSAVHQSIKSPLLANVQLYCSGVCMCVGLYCMCLTCCVDSVQTSGDVLLLWACFIHQWALSTVWRQRTWSNGVMRKYTNVCWT